MPPSSALKGLNPAQREAAAQIRGPVLILAGAGTGKTRVITTRISHMVGSGIPAREILAVTFTNKAATEMRERVSTMVPKAAAKDLTISTFHSLCVRILRSCIDKLGYKKNFTIYTQSDQLGLIRKIIVRKAGKEENLDAKNAQMMISTAKNKGRPIADSEDALIADVFRAYQQELKQLNAVDFDDLLLLAVRALEEHPDARAFWQSRFRYLMVDEFQDTNSLQMNLLRLLSGPEKNVCVVGDDDQSIYGWRGAEISNILDFERFFPNPKVVKLEENYRSTNIILKLANSLIRHNRHRREKTLWSSKGEGETVRVIAMPDAETEAEMVVNEIVDARRLENRKWEDFAILFRMNTQSRIFEEALRRSEVPYKVIGGQSFYERREVKDLLAYLCLFLNPDDDISLLRAISSPPRGIGAGTVEAATQFSIEHQISIHEALQHPGYLDSLSTKARGAVERFVEFVARYHDPASTDSTNYALLTEELIKELDYNDYLRRTCKDENETDNRQRNVREMIEGMYGALARGKRGLRAYLDSVALMQDRDDDDKEQGWGVSLITMHAAKGLEFPVCNIVGVEEGVLPHSRSVQEGTRDEERRLLYVGITRAQERLTLTWCRARKRYGDRMPCVQSSFFKEMDPAHLEILNYEDLAGRQATEEVAEDYFARIKALLAG
ncbi:MAG: UvrD-helicase domain-containing protein [Verrucomicrobiales bacterium]|nr:UvrD-helicase domain-containing protein [Verrucomicrobiales bacterium]